MEVDQPSSSGASQRMEGAPAADGGASQTPLVAATPLAKEVGL